MTRSARAITVRASAANVSATTETFDIDTVGRTGLIVHLKTTAGTGYSQTPTLLGVDDVTGDTYTLLVGVPMTASCAQTLTVGRGITATTNVSASAVLPRKVRVQVTHTDTTSVTYVITAEVV